MKWVSISLAILFLASGAICEPQKPVNVIELSRTSGVLIQSKNSAGSGAFIGDQLVLTCFHVVASLDVQGATINWTVFPDLQVVLPSGETIPGTVVSVPTQTDSSPLVQDFALVRLKTKPTKAFAKTQLASEKEIAVVGDDVVFSGYPLGTPGMVTHRGMVSGFDPSSTLIIVEASI